jgi:hypothetical protein
MANSRVNPVVSLQLRVLAPDPPQGRMPFAPCNADGFRSGFVQKPGNRKKHGKMKRAINKTTTIKNRENNGVSARIHPLFTAETVSGPYPSSPTIYCSTTCQL